MRRKKQWAERERDRGKKKVSEWSKGPRTLHLPHRAERFSTELQRRAFVAAVFVLALLSIRVERPLALSLSPQRSKALVLVALLKEKK